MRLLKPIVSFTLAVAAVTVLLSLLAFAAGRSSPAGEGITTPEPETVVPPPTEQYTDYLPVVMRNYAPPIQTVVVTVPVAECSNIIFVGSGGKTHAEAYDPSGSGVYASPGCGLGAGIRTNDYGYYLMERGFLAAQIPDYGGRRVVTAGLNLIPYICYSVGSPLPPPTVTLHPGTWEGFLPQNGRELWGAWLPQAVGRYASEFSPECFTDDPSRPITRVVIPIDPAWVVPGKVLKLVLRDSEDDVDFRPRYPSHSRHFFDASDYQGGAWLEIGLEK